MQPPLYRVEHLSDKIAAYAVPVLGAGCLGLCLAAPSLYYLGVIEPTRRRAHTFSWRARCLNLALFVAALGLYSFGCNSVYEVLKDSLREYSLLGLDNPALLLLVLLVFFLLATITISRHRVTKKREKRGELELIIWSVACTCLIVLFAASLSVRYGLDDADNSDGPFITFNPNVGIQVQRHVEAARPAWRIRKWKQAHGVVNSKAGSKGAP